MKLRMNKLILYLILLSIIFENQLFHVVKIDNIFFKIITIILIFLSFILVSYIKKIKQKVCNYIFFIMIFIFIIQFVYSVFILKNDIYGFLAESFRFLLVFAIPSFIYILKNKNLSILFWKNIKIIIFIQYLVSTLAIILLQVKGINITNRSFSYRSFGNISVSIYSDSIFIPLVMIYSFYQILTKKRKYEDFFIVILGLLHSLLIIKSRAIVISFLLSAFIMFIFCKRKKILKLSILIMCIIYLLKNNFLLNIFHLKKGNFASSNQGHLKAIQECWNYFLNNPFLGGGINLDWAVSYCDAGFIGLLANVGIGAIIIYILPLLTFFFIFIKRKFLFKEDLNILFLGYFSFVCLTSVTLILTDDVRMYGFVFILSIFYVLTDFPNCNVVNYKYYTKGNYL